MATSAVSYRTIWIPVNAGLNAQRVLTEIYGKLSTLAFSAPNVTRMYKLGTNGQLIDQWQVEFQITSANDTTLVGNFAGWASLLGIALLDTNVVSTTAGH